jgi:hypothetical protein
VEITEGLQESFPSWVRYPDYIDVASPAAGANASFSVGGQNYLRVLAATATLTTDANAANRFLSLDYINARGVTYVRNAAGLVVTASTTNQAFHWNIDRGVAEWAANTPVLAPLLSLFLDPGMTVQFTVDNKQVGDQLSAIRLVVEKIQTGPEGYPLGPAPYGPLAR